MRRRMIAVTLIAMTPSAAPADPLSEPPNICLYIDSPTQPVVCTRVIEPRPVDYQIIVTTGASTTIAVNCPQTSAICDGAALGRTGLESYSLGHAGLLVDKGQEGGPNYHCPLSHSFDIYYPPTHAPNVVHRGVVPTCPLLPEESTSWAAGARWLSGQADHIKEAQR